MIICGFFGYKYYFSACWRTTCMTGIHNATSPILILQYIMSGMVLSSFSVMSSVIVVNIHYRSADTTEMSNWIKFVFVKTLPKYLYMERPATKNDRKKKKLQKFLDKLSMQNGTTEFDSDGVPISRKFNPGFITQSTDMSRHATTEINDSPIMGTKASMTSLSINSQLTNRKSRRFGAGAENNQSHLPNQGWDLVNNYVDRFFLGRVGVNLFCRPFFFNCRPNWFPRARRTL